MTDGLSNTLHIVEQAGGDKTYNKQGQVIANDNNLHFRSWAGFNRLSMRGFSSNGLTQYGGNCVINCTSNGSNLYSFHIGGAHALLGDGSVRFLSENLDRLTAENLVTRNDGNPVGEF